MRASFLCGLLLISAVTLTLGQDANFGNGPQYLTNGSPLFARPISTPSMSLQGPPLEVGARDATGVLAAGAENQTVIPPLTVAPPTINLFPIYYGDVTGSEGDISSPEPSQEISRSVLPVGILDTGVWWMASPPRERGYGISVGGPAVPKKAHATRVYTNADIDRLRGRN